MKKKLLLGLSGLTMLNAEGTLLNDIQPEVVDKQENFLKEVKIAETDEKAIKKFYEEIKNTQIVSSLGSYSLKSFKLTQSENKEDYRVQYELENEYKETSLFFPVIYENKAIKKIVPVFYDTKSKKLKSYELVTRIKPLKQSTVDKIFPKNSRVILNNPSKPKNEKIVFIETESDESMNYLKGMYSKDMITLKDEYRDTKVSVVFLPFNFYDQKNSLQISALVKEYSRIYGNIDIYLQYIADRNKVLKKIRKKYLKIFKENYAGDFILEMYTEEREKIDVLSDYLLTNLIKKIESQSKSDIVILVKKEEEFVEGLMRLDFIDSRIAELSKRPNQDTYSFNLIEEGEGE